MTEINSATDTPAGEVADMSQKLLSEDDLREFSVKALRQLRHPPENAPEAASDKDFECRKKSATSLRQLRQPDAPPAYPVDALGPLQNAAEALIERWSMPPALAAQSLLGAAALLAQSLGNARTLDGIKPLSCYFLVVAPSGNAKSSADREALSAIYARAKAEARAYDRLRAAAKQANADPPSEPYRLCRDATIEGVRRSFSKGRASQGLFSAEAGAILNGHGMRAENRLKTASWMSAIWDDGRLSIDRGTDGRIELYDRRLSVSWAIQPAAIDGLLYDTAMSDVGFWPRFALGWAELGPPRAVRDIDAENDPRLRAYRERCNALLDAEPESSVDCSGLRVIAPNAAARRVFEAFWNETERESRVEGGRYTSITAFAARACETACRLSGVLTIFAGREEIDAHAAECAVSLAKTSLDTWLWLFTSRHDAELSRHLPRLLEFVKKCPDQRASRRTIQNRGPSSLRDRQTLERALAEAELQRKLMFDGRFWCAT